MKFASEQKSRPVTLVEALGSARETRALEIGSGILSRTAKLFREQFGDRPVLLVMDSITKRIAGDEIMNSFAGASDAPVERFIYKDPILYAQFGYVTQLEEVLKQNNCIPVAVGAGTINDLTKLAAHRAGRQYICVATAASMDGYTAFGASITHNGSKQTFVCPAPQAVLADLKIIQAAPPEMNASGYADLLAKTTAGADWILADALGVELIQPDAWRIVQGGLREMVARPEGIPTGELNAISHLTSGLMLAGFAMQSAQSSRAASGAEHQFSHLWDMQHHTHNGAAPSHGFKVGIATLAVTALYECLFALPIEELDIAEACAKWPDDVSREKMIRDLFPEAELQTVALKESAAKNISRQDLWGQLELLQKLWPDLRPCLEKQLFAFKEVKRMLQAAGAACEPEQIGITRERLRASFRQASLIRRRFTVLDVVSRAGLLESLLDRIFGVDGVWPAAGKQLKLEALQ